MNHKQKIATGMASLLLALAGTACGSGDEDENGNGDATAANGIPALPREALDPQTADEKHIVAMYTRYGNAMADTDAKGACAELSPRAQKVISSGMSGGCVARLRALYDSGEQSQLKPYIVELKVSGRTARAGVKTKTSEIYPVVFAKQTSGQWKIDGDGKS